MERSVGVHAVWKVMCKHAPSQVCSAFAHFVLQESCKFAYFIMQDLIFSLFCVFICISTNQYIC